MALVVPNQGERKFLEYLIQDAAVEDYVVKLFTNTGTPSESWTEGNLDEVGETVYSGPVTLVNGGWVTIDSPDGITVAIYEAITFSVSESASVYGYYVMNAAGNALMWVERFDSAPFVIPAGGGQIEIEIRLQLD